MRFLGICRKAEFSPNHVVNDSLIFRLTADALRQRGAEVRVLEEADVHEDAIEERLVFSMAQGPRASEALARIERERELLILNSPRAVMDCYRTRLVRLVPESGVPFPRSVIVKTATADGALTALGEGKAWLKRGDVHAVHREDVILTSGPEERQHGLKEFQLRDIPEAVLQEHLPGDTVKFYGVRGSNFFHWFQVDGGETRVAVSRLRELAEASAAALGLWIYGGDAIVAPDSGLSIIDVNDWPSFAPVREQASRTIADLLLRRAKDRA
jgi:hypothetical protein